jgi:uncharacterized Tic20 family protein
MTFDPAASSSSPAPSDPSIEERNWAVGAHLSGFLAAYLALGILGPTIVYFLKGSTAPFVRAHAVEAINFNITALIGIAIGAVLFVVGIGIFLLAAIGIAYLVCTIRGALAARDGKLYRYPMTLRFIS